MRETADLIYLGPNPNLSFLSIIRKGAFFKGMKEKYACIINIEIFCLLQHNKYSIEGQDG